MKLKMSKDELRAFLVAEFPQVQQNFIIEDIVEMGATLRLPVTDSHLRPGGTVSGPTLFGLADVAMYMAVLAMIGPVGLAVTTSCAIDFMRRPVAGNDLVTNARILKLGRVLAVGDVLIYSDGTDAPVARASLTYSIPPKR